MNLPSIFRNKNIFDLSYNGPSKDEISKFPRELSTSMNEVTLDLEEKDDKYIITAEVPGAKKENVDVTLDNKTLCIDVKNTGKSEKKQKNYICKEKWESSYSRSIVLPLADEEKVKTKIKDGVLTVDVKKCSKPLQ